MRPFLQAAEVGASWYPCIFGEVCFAWPIQGDFSDSPGNTLDVACATLSGNGADWQYSLDRLRASAFAIHVFGALAFLFAAIFLVFYPRIGIKEAAAMETSDLHGFAPKQE